MHRLIQEIEAEQMKLLKKDIPRFKVGDTVSVSVKVEEGDKVRTQMFEGVVIRKQGSGLRESFTVRKISFGEGVERSFPFYSPTVQAVQVMRSGKVRRAKLYYLRKTVGKKARIEEERRPEEAPSAPPASSPAPNILAS
ncbi:MAG: 50S ribosomal protein L19 [Candidatus Omnitrophica bacterium]|nr:50S ribosomal protein L19 [Candidatus Omnitrophota bacterium]